jgi:streptomycin 6-kinase
MTRNEDPASVPPLDDGVRERLTARFGPGIGSWLAELPDALGAIAERWQLAWGPVVPRGSMSVVIRCETRDGRPAVLKVSPDRARLANEAAALHRWTTVHTPAVLAVDADLGALLIDAIEPGTPLIDSLVYPEVEAVAELLNSLHANGVPDEAYPPLAHRVEYLFDSGTKPYERHPTLLKVVPPELYERGRRLATQLAESVSPAALLHGDLTPSNILDGGPQRGLVAIDPAPCLGDDLAFDAIDLLLWQPDDIDAIAARAELLAPSIGSDTSHLLDWCVAFAAMVALESAGSATSDPVRVQTYLMLAAQSPEA